MMAQSKYTQLRPMFIAGVGNLRELSDWHGVSYSGLRHVAAREKWHKLREESSTALQSELQQRHSRLAYSQIEMAQEMARVFSEAWNRHRAHMTTKDCAYMARAMRDVMAAQRTAIGLPVEYRDKGAPALRVDIGALAVALGQLQQQPIVDAPKLRAIQGGV